MKKLTLLLVSMLIASGAYADELRDKSMSTKHDLEQAIAEMHVMQQEHDADFDGHLARAEQLARQAEAEREAALEYYRAHHPGWQ
ncbi:hypothetical protein [Paraburkholderia heleia]|uniref:hypothetical protein n=1 Tax=Paraburkholderia heleia TaxID=634127 RepID=UPI002AB66567|nr:hypothetical protein [Paraburkholderia heleia]